MTGNIVHVEFPAEDADRAERFWSRLFGWSFQGSGMEGIDYRMAQAGDRMGTAVFPAESRSGYPNYYFSTEDIDASSSRIRDLGGQADDKQPVPGHGWFAACKDSEGNAFHLWQGDSSAA